MRHEGIDTTMIYGHLTERHINATVKKLNF